LENDRISHQAKISELNHKVTLLNSHLSQAMKQVKRETSKIAPTFGECLFPHIEKGLAPRGVNSEENNCLWAPQGIGLTGNLTGMSNMMLDHLITFNKYNRLHPDGMYDKKVNQFFCTHKEQSSSIAAKNLKDRIPVVLNDKLEICPHKKLKNLVHMVPHSLEHTNPIFLS